MREPCWTKTPVSSKNSDERHCGVVENRSEERLGVKKGDVDEGEDSEMHTGVSKITLLEKTPSWRLKTPPRDTPRTPGPRPWV
jgi:hypothetical protein